MAAIAYPKNACVAFLKTKEKHGYLSNMANVSFMCQGMRMRTGEHLYQALKHSDSDIQQKILSEPAPMIAKRNSREHVSPYKLNSLKLPLMYLVLTHKATNAEFMSELLTTKGSIVEISYRDTFWGAKPTNDSYVGLNYLGRLLMALRDRYEPPLNWIDAVKCFKLLGKEIHYAAD